jgi:hypothetical protein
VDGTPAGAAGRDPDRRPSKKHRGVFYATGHGHLGLTYAATTARLIADLITGVRPPIDLNPYRGPVLSLQPSGGIERMEGTMWSELYIDGKEVTPFKRGTFDVINPTTEEVIHKIAAASAVTDRHGIDGSAIA